MEPAGREPGAGIRVSLYRLSEQGRAKLGSGASKPINVGREAVDHLRVAYPKALASVPRTAAISLRNFINRRVRAAIAEHEVRPGWSLVPIEPTKEMAAAGERAVDEAVELSRDTTSVYVVQQPMRWAIVGYRAMLDAAPQPQQEDDR